MQSISATPTQEYDTHSDHELIESALRGDQNGFEQLLLRYQSRLFQSIRCRVECPTIAEDIVEEAFSKAFLHLSGFRNQSSFFTWLYRIALNLRRKNMRDYNKNVQIDAVFVTGEDAILEPHCSPSQQAERCEEREEVRSALKRLSDMHRKILILREFNGFDYNTIAEIMHIDLGTVRSRLHRAREQLKKELSGYFSEGTSGADKRSVNDHGFGSRSSFCR